MPDPNSIIAIIFGLLITATTLLGIMTVYNFADAFVFKADRQKYVKRGKEYGKATIVFLIITLVVGLILIVFY